MKLLKILGTALAVAGLVAMSGCSSTRAYSDYVEGVNFNQFKSFAWLPSTDSVSDNIYDNQIVMQNIRNQINQEMTDRGYAIDSKNPELLLITHVNFEEKEEMLRSPVYSSYNYYYPGFYAGPGYPYYYYNYSSVPNVIGYNITPVEFTEGTIVIDLIRADTRELIWRGWSETRIDDPDRFRKEVKASVDEIFDKYPLGEKRRG